MGNLIFLSPTISTLFSPLSFEKFEIINVWFDKEGEEERPTELQDYEKNFLPSIFC